MTYAETIAFLQEKLPMFTRQGGVALKKDLTNIRLLCEALGNPQEKFKSIHVGGTNGKGSVSHFLASVLHYNHFKTGLYTSPHIKDFRERIRVNGEEIPESDVIRFTEEHIQLIREIEPSFFEMTVAMAFDFFAKQKVDIAVVEVGLGGLLDSTNILFPDLSIITNISLEHTDILGHTLPEIAEQKAGIIKQGIPVVIGETHPETEPVFRRIAGQKNAPLFFADQNYQAEYGEDSLEICNVKGKCLSCTPGLRGVYQVYNLKTVLQAVDVLSDRMQTSFHYLEDAIQNVVWKTGIRGRFEMIQEHPKVILDVSHNEEGIRYTMEQIQKEKYDHLHIVCAFVRDKDVAKILKHFPADASYYFSQADIPRALDKNILKRKADEAGLKGKVYSDIPAALDAAKEKAVPEDLIWVTGSFFNLGEII